MKLNNLVSLVSILALALLAIPTFAADAPSLDGKTFSVEVRAQGADSGYPDTLVFTGGTFRSTACDEYGFSAASYATEGSGQVTFTATATSAEHGVAEWTGQIVGGAVSGSFTWAAPGQEPATYTFEGTAD